VSYDVYRRDLHYSKHDLRILAGTKRFTSVVCVCVCSIIVSMHRSISVFWRRARPYNIVLYVCSRIAYTTVTQWYNYKIIYFYKSDRNDIVRSRTYFRGGAVGTTTTTKKKTYTSSHPIRGDGGGISCGSHAPDFHRGLAARTACTRAVHTCARAYIIILTSGRRYLARAITASPSPPPHRLPKCVVIIILNRFEIIIIIIIVVIGDVGDVLSAFRESIVGCLGGRGLNRGFVYPRVWNVRPQNIKHLSKSNILFFRIF